MTEIKVNGFRRARFPWRVSFCQKDRHPTIVAADGQVVAYIMNGSWSDAMAIAASCNAHAERQGIEEV